MAAINAFLDKWHVRVMIGWALLALGLHLLALAALLLITGTGVIEGIRIAGTWV